MRGSRAFRDISLVPSGIPASPHSTLPHTCITHSTLPHTCITLPHFPKASTRAARKARSGTEESRPLTNTVRLSASLARAALLLLVLLVLLLLL